MPLDASQKLILAFVTLILGIILTGVVATNIIAVTQKVTSDDTIDISAARLDAGDINETYIFTVTNAPTDWKIQETECALTNFALTNGTDTYEADTDYTLTASTGKFTLANTTTVYDGGNTTIASYNYCQDDYLTQSWQRSVTNLIGGFFALALLLISVGLFWSVAKDYGFM